MGFLRTRMTVEMDDGATWEVFADQRDWARWEVQPAYSPEVDRIMSRIRFMAYSASIRAGLTDLSWPKFDAACVEAAAPPDDGETVDPTRPGPPGVSS